MARCTTTARSGRAPCGTSANRSATSRPTRSFSRARSISQARPCRIWRTGRSRPRGNSTATPPRRPSPRPSPTGGSSNRDCRREGTARSTGAAGASGPRHRGARVSGARDRARRPGGLRRALHQADDVTLGIGELADLELVRYLVRAHQPPAAEALSPRERGLHVGHLDVEGDVPGIPLRSRSDAAADPNAVGVGVLLTRHEPVVHRVVAVDLPAEQVGVIILYLCGILTYYLEM